MQWRSLFLFLAEVTGEPHGSHLETTWRLLGNQIETTSIPKETATTLWKRNFLKFWNRMAASTILAPLPPLFNNFVVVNGSNVAAVEQQRWTC